MANLHIEGSTEIDNTNITLSELINKINNLDKKIVDRTNKISNEMINMSKVITGEFNLFLGNKYFVSDTTWKWLSDSYSTYYNLTKKFPLRTGYTRTYKLCLEKTDSITQEVGLYISLWNWYTVTHITDFIFQQSWGSSEDGVITYYEMDFDINWIKDIGHTKWYTTPAFSIGNGYAWRIYRLYIKVIDTYTGVAF